MGNRGGNCSTLSARERKRAEGGTGARHPEMSKSCSGMLEEMLKCVEGTECVKKNSLKACVKDGKLFPTQCELVKQVYDKCKRGQLDMRSRLRGNKGY